MLARLAARRRDGGLRAGDRVARAAAARGRRCCSCTRRCRTAAWRYLPDGRQYPIEGVEYPGLASEGWVGPQWQVDQGFQRHVLQVQYVDRLVGRLLDALRARGLFDDAVIVVAADHGASFVTGQPRRPANRDERRRRSRRCRCSSSCRGSARVASTTARCGRPTCCRRSPRRPACGCRGRRTGWPADEREVDPGAPIDVSHAGEPVLTEPLGLRAGEARGSARRSRRGCCATASTRSGRGRS